MHMYIHIYVCVWGEDLNWWAASGQQPQFSPVLQLKLAKKGQPPKGGLHFSKFLRLSSVCLLLPWLFFSRSVFDIWSPTMCPPDEVFGARVYIYIYRLKLLSGPRLAI